MPLKFNDKGFSLVEMLVALAMLALIIVPLLHSFVTATRTGEKARAAGDATAAAQNIVESLDSIPMSGLIKNDGDINKSRFSATDAAFYKINLFGAYERQDPPAPVNQKKYYLGLRGLTAGSHTYDAMVTLSASTSQTNDMKITQYTPMDAVFSQPNDSQNPDLLAAQEFADTASLQSLRPYTPEEVNSTMSRSITLNIQKTPDKDEITVTVQYDYKFSFKTLPPDLPNPTPGDWITKNLTTNYAYELYRGTDSAETPGLSAIYCFFYPRNLRDAAEWDDRIIIRNPDNLTLDCFLVKQKTKNFDTTGYRALVELRESQDSDGVHIATYSNLGTDLDHGTPIVGNPISYRIYHGNVWYKTEQFVDAGALVVKTQKNRLYDVEIQLFESVTNPTFLEDPLLTFHATKLN